MNHVEHIGKNAIERYGKPGYKTRKNHDVMTEDLPDTELLEDSFQTAVCAFVGFQECATTLYCMLDRFDESHEDYDSASWLNLSIEPQRSNSLIVAGYEAIEAAGKIMACISDNTERQCKKLLHAVLSAPAKQQMKILGTTCRLRGLELDLFIDAFFEILDGIDFGIDADENYEVFVGSLNCELDNGFKFSR